MGQNKQLQQLRVVLVPVAFPALGRHTPLQLLHFVGHLLQPRPRQQQQQ
jgi:hypothetical protein